MICAFLVASSGHLRASFPRFSPVTSSPLRTYITDNEPIKDKQDACQSPVVSQASSCTAACVKSPRRSPVRMQAEVEAEVVVEAPAATVAELAVSAPAAAEPAPYPTQLLEDLGGYDVETGGGIWDPLRLAALPEADLTYYREAEIKHGRVAMLATVGYAAAKAGLVLPGFISRSAQFSDLVAANPFDEWANVPELGKVQLFTLAAFIELSPYQVDGAGYGTEVTGKIGENPLLKKWLPWLRKAEPRDDQEAAKRAASRLSELKNGRLAMISIAGLYASETVPGSVPFHF